MMQVLWDENLLKIWKRCIVVDSVHSKELILVRAADLAGCTSSVHNVGAPGKCHYVMSWSGCFLVEGLGKMYG